MLTPSTKGPVAPTDKEGYLLDLADWSPEVAERIAQREGIALTDEHWRIIRLLRDFYAAHDLSPTMRPLVRRVYTELGPEAGTSLHLLKLFPGNPAKIAAKIAGLPRPTNCL